MQRLMQVAHEMNEQEQRLFLVLDRKRRRRRLVLQYGNGGADGRDQIVTVGSLEISVKAAALDRDVLEVKHGVARARDIRLAFPVPLCVIHGPRPLPRRIEGRAGYLVLQMIRIDHVVKLAVVILGDTPHAVGPGTRLAQVEVLRIGIGVVEDFLNLLLRVRLSSSVVRRRWSRPPGGLQSPRRTQRSETQGKPEN